MTTHDKPRHHLTTDEIIAAAMVRRYVPFHWHVVAMDVVLRPWSTAEIAERVDQDIRFTAAKAEYERTQDEANFVTSEEQVRWKLAATLPCVLYPDDKTRVFPDDAVDALLTQMPTSDIMELIGEVERISNLTAKEAEEAAKNSAETAASSTASVSPSAPATPTSSLSLMR